VGALRGDPVLLTGGTGFLGGHVARALHEAGYTVVNLVRRKGGALPALPDARCVEGDLEEPASLQRALEGVAAVIHVAGLVSNAARDRRRLFGTSAVGALRQDRPDLALREDAEFDLRDLAVPYVQAKREAHEAAVRAREAGLPIVALSPTFALGPGDRRLTSSELVDAFVRRRLPGVLAGGINAVDVRDLAPAYVAALEHPDPAPHYILAGPENLTSLEFYRRLEHCSGVAAPRWAIPRWAALAAGACVERLAPAASFTSATVRMGSLYWYFDGSLARRELGFEARSLDETLRSAVDWVRKRS